MTDVAFEINTTDAIRDIARADDVIRFFSARVASGEIDANAALVSAARGLLDRVELLVTRAVGRFEESGAPELDRWRDVGAWLEQHTTGGRGEGHRRVHEYDVLESLPHVDHAAQTGVIGSTQLRLLASAVTTARLGFAKRDQHLFVDWATNHRLRSFKVLLRNWVSKCDDALSNPSTEDWVETKRSFQLTQTADGSWIATGVLETLAGEALHAALESAMTVVEGDTRTRAQRRHDALHDIAMESLANASRPLVHGERPHVSVVLNTGDGKAFTAGSMVFLSSFTRDMILCDCVTTSVWVDASGVPFDVGNPNTAIPLKTRRAVIARDLHCRYPGCSHPPRWTDIHHIRYRRDGGDNRLDNLVLLCRYHHRKIHRETLQLDWDHNTLTITWPNGTKATSPPITPTLYCQ